MTDLASVVERLPAAVRNKATMAGADRWLETLPVRLGRLERHWSITVESVFPDATEALVATVRRAGGDPAVLKVLVPHGERVLDEITVLELAGGEGCANLLRADRGAGALLVERLGPSMADLEIPLSRRLALLTDAARRVWRPVSDVDLPTGADRARRLMTRIEELWPELDRPCDRRAVDHALACGERRRAADAAARDAGRTVLVHGDVHRWNALADPAGTGFKLVDPDGAVAEPECDLGPLMREDPVELMAGDPRDRAVWLAARAGLDAEAVWQWGVVDRLATGLALTAIGVEPVAGEMLAAADAIALEVW